MSKQQTPDKRDRTEQTSAAGFTRSLMLTAAEDIWGVVLNALGRLFITIVASVTILAVFLIIFFVAQKAWPFLASGHVFEAVSSSQWHPTNQENPDFGFLAMFYGSGIVTLVSMLIAVPLGVAAAVYLSDIAPFSIRQMAKPVVELLAAIPSVAYGFFAVVVLAPWLQNSLGLTTGTNALNASLILAVMAVPTIISISEDALSSVGRDIREGAYALGATRAEVMIKVIIPAAHSGIFAAVILGIMRAVGETMAVWMASGMAAKIAHPWWDITQSVRTMTATIAQEMREAPQDGVHRQALFSLGVMLVLITFCLNLAGEYFLRKAKKAKQG